MSDFTEGERAAMEAERDRARHEEAQMEAEYHRQMREEYDGQQALEFAVNAFGVPGALQRIADLMKPKPADIQEPF